MKKSKQALYDNYFERDWNNVKNTWKEMKSLISLKSLESNVPTVLSLFEYCCCSCFHGKESNPLFP